MIPIEHGESEALCQLATDVLTRAKKMGADMAEVDVHSGHGFSVAVRLGNVDIIENNRGRGISITLYYGKRSGVVSLSDFSTAAIDLALQKAANIARYTQEDPCAGLADADLLAYDYPDLELYHPWDLDIATAIELAKASEASGLQRDKRIVNSEGASIFVSNDLHVYANTYGFLGVCPTSSYSCGFVFIAKDNDDMERFGDEIASREPLDFAIVDKVAAVAADKTVARLGAKPLTTRECPVIFHASIAKSLFGNFLSAINGGNLHRKSSFLLDHLGMPVFSDVITMHEDPHIMRALGSSPFDAEGVQTRPRELVHAGVLQGYILDSYAARKLNLQTTGNAGGCHNIIVAGKTAPNFDELLRLMGNGLLITELLGQGVNIVTGNYSRGAFGFWVENGEIQYPVCGVTIAGNLRNMYSDIIAVADDVDKRGSIFSGSVLIEKMVVAGQ